MNEEKLRKTSDSEYGVIFDLVNDAVFIHDPDTGDIIDMNSTGMEMFGYTKDEMRRLTVEDLSSGVPPYTGEKGAEKIRAAARGDGKPFEWRCKDKTGRLFWVEVNLKSASMNGLTRVVATVRDISARKLTEQELRESEMRFRMLQEASFAGIAVHDHGIILDCNQALCDLTGYTAQELHGLTGTELVAPEYGDLVRKNVASGYPKAYDVEGLRKDGSRYPLEIRGKNIPYHGRTVRVTEFRDISERKRMEEVLKRSETLLKHAQEISRIGGWELEVPSLKMSWTDEVYRIFGLPADYDPNDIDADLSFYDPEYRPLLKEKLDRALEKGEPYDLELKVTNARGEKLWVRTMGRPEVRGGRVVRITGNILDITELKNAREALQKINEELERKVAERTGSLREASRLLEEQKVLLQTIVDRIPVIVTLWNSDRTLSLVNKEFERLTGWSLEETAHVDILAETFPDPAYRKELIRRVAKADPGWGEFVMTNRAGEHLIISWAAVRLPGGSLLGIGIDITARKKMEQDITRLFAAVEQAGEGIAVSSPEGVLEYVNPAYERISGYSRGELVGRSVASFPEYAAYGDEQEIFNAVWKERKVWSGRQTRKRKTGEIIDVDVSVSPVLDEAGRVINLVAVIQDITRQLRLERQLAQNQKMEAIGSLAGGIAHDLKNILTPILMNTEIALEDVGDAHPARPVLEETLSAARLGKDLVDQILTFSKRTHKMKTAVNMTSLIRETLAFLRSTLPSTIDIKSELKDDAVMAYADPTQIKQVLINLGSNAGHAMGQGGTLDVSESVEELDAEQAAQISADLAPGPYIEVKVHDTGHGMDEETMEHIFEPFFTTKKGEGTGMGLAVAHGIVKEHHGAITVQSRPGQGSTFTVLLPKKM